MAKNARTIRTELYELIEARLFEMDCDSLLGFSRKHPGEELFPEPLCPFVNRLCPDDLCYLPAGHSGAKEGYHITGTTAYDHAERWKYGKTDNGPVGVTRQELISMGHKLQNLDSPV